MSIEDAVAATGAKKVFIMLGMNDIALYGIDATMEYWVTLLSRIRQKCPDVQIYIQSMSPIWTGGEVGALRNENADRYNQRLQTFAAQQGCGYIDVASYLKDSTGGLATRFCSDNYVHLTYAATERWVQVLKAYTGYME
jgi:lysophospholipase L1-like esterase